MVWLVHYVAKTLYPIPQLPYNRIYNTARLTCLLKTICSFFSVVTPVFSLMSTEEPSKGFFFLFVCLFLNELLTAFCFLTLINALSINIFPNSVSLLMVWWEKASINHQRMWFAWCKACLWPAMTDDAFKRKLFMYYVHYLYSVTVIVIVADLL